MRATISLLGLYNYDNSILDGLTLPDNFTSDDLTALKNNLLMETAEFELLYSDFNFLKFAITQWCNKRKSTWEWLKETQLYEYNPLQNVNMHLDDHLGSKLEKDVITDFERHLKSAKTGHDDFDSDVHKTGHDDFDSDVHKTGHDDFDSDVHKTGHDDFDSDVHKTGHDDFDSDVHKTGNDKDEKRGSDKLLHSVYALDENLTPSPESVDTTTFNSDLKTTYDNNVNTDSSTTYNNNVNTDSSTTYNNNVNTDSSTTYNNNVNTDSSTTYNNNVNTDSTTTYNNVVDDTGTTKNTVDHDESLKKNYNKDWSGRDHITAQELIKQEQELAMFNILDFIIDDFKKRFCLLVY